LDEGGLVVIKAFAECGEVFVAVPLCEVGILELLFCLYVERAPCRVEVFKDLIGGCVAVGCVTMFQLRVELLVDCVTKICSDALEESFPNVPACA
jgi:hypothetical protein